VLLKAIESITDSVKIKVDIITDRSSPLSDQDHLKIHREIDESDKVRLMVESDVFVLANRHLGIDFEGFGYVVLEAMSAGIPCIVGKKGGPSEIIRDQIDGFVIDPDDPDQLEKSLTKLCADRELRRKMGDAARQRVLDIFSERAFESRMVEALQ